jgi:N-acetylneuraminate synthase
MDPLSWKDMVDRTRELEAAMGCGIKKVEDNEKQTIVLQRRAVRAVGDLPLGHVISPQDITVLRPCPPGAVLPYESASLIGKTLRNAKKSGDYFKHMDFE